jgi:hypothetical protein
LSQISNNARLPSAASLAPAAGPSPAAVPPAPDEVRRLFARLRVRRSADGRVILEAPAEAAATIGALFEGMAALLRAATDPAAEEAPP